MKYSSFTPGRAHVQVATTTESLHTSWLFETDAIEFLPASPPDPWSAYPPLALDEATPTDSKDANMAFWTLIESGPLLPGGGDFTTNSGDVVDDIDVDGEHPVEYPGFDPNPGGGTGGDWGGSGDTGGGGQPDCGCPTNSNTPAQQAEARARAAEGAAVVLGQNWENQEYGGFIYRDNATGQLVMAAITGSAIGTWSPTADNMAGISAWSQIVGIVHSHGPNVAGSFHNYPSTGDWAAFDSFISMGAANLSTFYIVGADGQLREYDANNRDHQTPGEIVSCC